MKVFIFAKLLLTGAFLTCSHSAFADLKVHNEGVQQLIEAIRADLDTLETSHSGDVEVTHESVSEERDIMPEKSPVDLEVPEEVEVSKVHELIKNYMDAQGSTARMVAEKVIRDEFKVDHKKTCFEVVKYIQDGGQGQEPKFGTLFGLMDMDARYATKGNKDILKGIREGVQMREKDPRGVPFKKKVKFTPEMLCKK